MLEYNNMVHSEDIFCRIAKKEDKAFVVAENNLAIAFLDREPATEGHALVIPKRHTNDIFDISKDEILAIMDITKQVGVVLQKVFGYSSIILHQVNGAGAQEVRHFHLHVYGGPKTKPYFYQQFIYEDELTSSLKETQRKMLERFRA